MVKLFRKKKDKKNKTPKGGHEVERKLLTEDAAQIAMGDDEIIFEGEKPEIAREIDRVASLLENEITNGIYEEQAKTLHNISLTSDNDDDDTSLENEMNDLTSSQVLLQTELEKVDYGGESDSSGDSMGDMLAQHLIDEDLYLRIHDQLPLVDEYKAGIRQQSSKMVFSRPDPPQEAKPLVSIDPEATIPTDPGNHLSFSERQCRLSQLPSVDEIRGTHMEDEKASLYLEWLVCCLLILVALSIMLPIILIDQTKSREAHVMTFISNHEISKLEDLTKPGTPQNKAARWIADSDGLHVKISTGRSFLDRYALAVLFYALGGDGTWPSDLNFLSREHVCHWTKTTSNELTAGVSGCKNIDGEMVPVGIALAFHGLNGHIPDEIRYLDKVETLILQWNPALGGTIPSVIGSFSNLQTLSIQHCTLTGTLPIWMGDMTALTSLDLGDNRLTGQVPDAIQKLTNLKTLELSSNFFSGDLKMFGALSNLRNLYLDDNKFEGALTSSLLRTWKHMVELDLSENIISSKLPEHLFSHKTLKVLDMHANRLTGEIPAVKEQMNGKLEFLALHENELTREIPSSIALLRSLHHLDLSRNDLRSTVPEAIGTMKNLKYLFIGGNDFSKGEIPNFLTSLDILEDLSMKNAGLTGTLPNSVGFLSTLKYLDLSDNELTGSLPDTLGFLSDLGFLLLRNNTLSGDLPDELNRLANLDVFLIEANNFTGTADVICLSDSINVKYFTSDCGGSDSEFECSCCTVCCELRSCGHTDWNGNLDPQWEIDYKRTKYELGSGVIFSP